MPDQVDATKRKKQIAMIAVLAIGLLVAILTQPKSQISTKDASEDAITANPAVSTQSVSTGLVSGQPVSAMAEETLPDESTSDAERFAIRELSRIEWDEMRHMTLFRPRPMESALAGTPQATDGPIRVEAIYGATSKETDVESSLRRSALIGRAIVRPGEALPDGRTILDVTTEGVAVAP